LAMLWVCTGSAGLRATMVRVGGCRQPPTRTNPRKHPSPVAHAAQEPTH
jgi:hypothetical protein